MLNPELYGIWIGLNILLAYSGFANLGLEYVFAIRYPYYQGKHDQEKCSSIADTVYFVWTLATALLILGLTAYFIFFPPASNLLLWGLISIGIIIFFEQQNTFFNRWITAGEKNFSFPSYISILRNTCSFVIIVPLVFYFSTEGLMVGSAIVSSIVFFIWISTTSFKFGWTPSFSTLKEMMIIGAPNFLISIVNTLVKSMDRLLIVMFLGAVSLGYYSIVAMGGGFLYMLLAQAGGVLVPHMVEEAGKNDDSSQSLEKYLIRPTLIFSYASAIFLVFVCFFIPLAINLILPQYIPGLDAFYVFLPGFFFLSIILSANNILYLVLIPRGKQRYILYLQLVSAVIQIGLSFLFIHFKWDIIGVALATTLASAFWGSSILALTVKYIISEWSRRIKFFRDVFRPFIYVLACMSVIYFLHKNIAVSSLVQTTIDLFLFAFTVSPLMYAMEKNTQIISLIAPILASFKMLFNNKRYESHAG